MANRTTFLMAKHDTYHCAQLLPVCEWSVNDDPCAHREQRDDDSMEEVPGSQCNGDAGEDELMKFLRALIQCEVGTFALEFWAIRIARFCHQCKDLCALSWRAEKLVRAGDDRWYGAEQETFRKTRQTFPEKCFLVLVVLSIFMTHGGNRTAVGSGENLYVGSRRPPQLVGVRSGGQQLCLQH